jgi:hypothetical protein
MNPFILIETPKRDLQIKNYLIFKWLNFNIKRTILHS